ncbi:MAG: TlpA family protein disulfide reductase [Gammaproteobacteria bacterium]|nr:TlpA family protein disulfide reductase [Gammaproteobacteria bacterium]
MLASRKTARPRHAHNSAALAIAFALLLCCLQQASVARADILAWPAENRLDEFSLRDIQDNKHKLSDYRGKVVLVNFWASWCPPCIYEMPELTNLKKHFADQPFEIIALNVGEKKYRVRKFVKLINFDLPVLLDTSSETFNSWGVKTLPTSFLLDANGQVRYRVRGNPGWENEQTKTMIENLIAETANISKLTD